MKDFPQILTGFTTLKLSQITLFRTLVILLDPCEERNDEKEDNEDHDVVQEGVEMKLGKEGTYCRM